MEIVSNLRRIKDNLLLIPEEKFDILSKDALSVSFVYLLGLLILSVPFGILVSFFSDSPLEALMSLPFSYLILIPVLYIGFGINHLFLKIVGGKAGFSETAATIIHGETLFLIISSIPCINFLAGLVALANIVIGAKRVHKISLIRSIIAIIVIPLILLVILFAFAILFFAMILGSTISSMGPGNFYY
ncbi:hypothetical protein JXA56_00650 [Candidatus Micrarchaeota archaeon]|nr:hypothetical protein [Candidatus Micrarchaeota archaeon]